MSDKQERTVERWVAKGARLASGGGRGLDWQTPDGDKFYSGPAMRRWSPVIGGIHEAEVTRDGDRVSLWGAPKYTGKRIEDAALIGAWEAKAHATEIELARAARQRKDKASGALDEALAPLEAIAAQLRTGADLDALVVFVTRRLYQAPARARAAAR